MDQAMVGGRALARGAAGRALRTGERRVAQAVALPAIVLCALLAAYWIVAFHPGSLAYVDYVDGYYLYVAHRMAQGAVLYSQLMGVQPPGIYLVGDALFRLHDGLATARLYAAALHSITVLLVFATALRLYRQRGIALLAAALYSLAPYSLIWSRTFDPNPLVTCLSLAMLLALLGGTPRAAALAGALGALALATKVWYVPIAVVTLLFLARHRRDLLRPYAAMLLGGTVLVLALGTVSAGAAFWRGLLAQDASGLSVTWLLAAVFDVLQRDWPLLLLGGAGLLTLGRTPAAALGRDGDVRAIAPWYLWASLSVLGATIKVGTFAPVFQFAEPALALFAAAALARWTARGSAVAAAGDGRAARHGGLLFAAVAVACTMLWVWPSLQAVGATSDRSVRAVVARIERASAPSASLLGPPFYLYLADRREMGEYADVNLWALADAQGDAAARALTRRTVVALRRRAIPLVLLDSRVARLPGVVAALHACYHRLPFADPLPADRAVTLWAPNAR
jgi:hypothetical protein